MYDHTLSEPEAGLRGDGSGGAEPAQVALDPRPRVWGLSGLPRAWKRPMRVGAEIPQGRSSDVVVSRDARYRRLLALADVCAAGFAIFGGVQLLGDDSLNVLAFVALLAVILVSKVIGLYDRDAHLVVKTTLDEAPALFQVATLYTLVVWLGEGTVVNGHLGRDQVIGLWALLFVAMLTSRTASRRIAQTFSAPERCLVIGDAQSADRFQNSLGCSHAKAEVIGRVPLGPEPVDDTDGPQVLGGMDTLGLTLVEHEIHRVAIAPGASESEEMLDAIRLVKSLGVKVSVLPRLFEVVGSSVEFENVNGVILLGMRQYGLTKSSQILKRTVDVIGAGLALLVLAPMLIAIALMVKLTSPGPVLFRQTRIGRDGKEFTLFKFRTMVDGAEHMKAELEHRNEADGLFKIAEDPRTTGVGRRLRRSSLDELPQLINVLRGEMSLVGPRPLVPHEDARVEGWHRHRLAVLPGMTGLWQIFGSSRIPLSEMVKIDYLYWANWSLWRDVKILLRTIPYALARRGL